MLFALFVEGRNDFYFFRNIVKTYKKYQIGTIEYDWKLALLLNYFKKLRTTVLTKNGDSLVIIEGRGKGFATKTFLYMIKEFLNNEAVAKSVLIIDADKSLDPKPSIVQKFSQQKITNLTIEESKIFKRLLTTTLKKYPKELETAIIDICPNLEVVISIFLKKFKIVSPEITKESDHHLLIRNAIENLKLNSYEDLCNYLTVKYAKELEIELTQICMLDTLCKIL